MLWTPFRNSRVLRLLRAGISHGCPRRRDLWPSIQGVAQAVGIVALQRLNALGWCPACRGVESESGLSQAGIEQVGLVFSVDSSPSMLATYDAYWLPTRPTSMSTAHIAPGPDCSAASPSQPGRGQYQGHPT